MGGGSVMGRVMQAAADAHRFVEQHLAVCRAFTAAVETANNRWTRPSPCTGWDARAVLEHVIGFHDVLVLRPLGAKPRRPAGDPEQRWALTDDAISSVLHRDDLLEGPVDVPAVGTLPPG